MVSIETWITLLAEACGLLVIVLPLIRVIRLRGAPRGQASGSWARLLRWPLILALAGAFVGAGVVFWRPVFEGLDPRLRFASSVVGAVLYFPGIALYVWGFLTLGSMFGVSSALGAELYKNHRLVEAGPFRLVRHPMYLGVMLAGFGGLLIFRTWAMTIFAPLMLTLALRARREEGVLASAFGECWEAYARRVPAWFPRLRFRRKGSG